jgi:preprotein translocase subunit SecD
MKTYRSWFNIYLLGALIFCGCATDPKKKELAAIRLHLEKNDDGHLRTGPVLVTQQRIPVNVDREYFLSEGDVINAEVVETMGGYAIELFFDGQGAHTLDMATTSNKGQRIAILVQYPLPDKKQFSRWVAAPMIQKRIANGVFIFTPDLTREEAERVTRGLKNAAEQAAKANKVF